MTSTSVHMARKNVVADTAFNHQIHDFLDDDVSSEDSDGEAPDTKNQNFEFSNGYGVMRIIRMVLVLQVISIALDNPSLEMSVLFRIACRGPLFYAIRFYSRPFIDLIYVVQYFLNAVIEIVRAQNLPANPSVSITNRKLNTNP
jgi:hypothetical protein